MVNLKVKHFNLKPFTLECKWEMDHYLSLVETEISDYSFASNYIWVSNASGFYGIINNTFCLFLLTGDTLSMLLPPLGKEEYINDAIIQCFDIMDSLNGEKAVSRIDYVCEHTLKSFVNFLEEGTEIFEILYGYLVERKLVDYVYRIDDLIELSGNDYKSKRNEINKFTKVYPDYGIEALDPQTHMEVCIELFNRWMANRMLYMPKEETEAFLDGMTQERFALKRIFKFFKELELFGIVLKIGGEVVGFTVGELLNAKTASIIVEKTDFEILGSAQFIFREFSKYIKETYGCEKINVGDDMGFENLKKVKMSYRPSELISKFTIYQKVHA